MVLRYYLSIMVCCILTCLKFSLPHIRQFSLVRSGKKKKKKYKNNEYNHRINSQIILIHHCYSQLLRFGQICFMMMPCCHHISYNACPHPLCLECLFAVRCSGIKIIYQRSCASIHKQGTQALAVDRLHLLML